MMMEVLTTSTDNLVFNKTMRAIGKTNKTEVCWFVSARPEKKIPRLNSPEESSISSFLAKKSTIASSRKMHRRLFNVKTSRFEAHSQVFTEKAKIDEVNRAARQESVIFEAREYSRTATRDAMKELKRDEANVTYSICRIQLGIQ